MTNALTLTASSLGRTSQPSGQGAVLYVDGDNAVTIDAWPQPSRWIPDHVQLFRGDGEVAAPQAGDDWRWVLTGEDRFGVFRAVARAGEVLVESAPMVVQPVPVTVLAGAAEEVPGPYVRPSRSLGMGAAPPGAPLPAAAPPGAAPPAPGSSAGTSAGSSPQGAATAAADPPGAPSPPLGTSPISSPVSAPPAGPTSAAAPRVPAHASAQDIAAMVEMPRSEWDGRFAAWVGATFAVLAGATLVYAATRLLGDPSLFDTTTPPGVPRDPGGPAPFVRSTNVADRIGLGTSTMVMALGIVVILAGAALAALEVRARMLGRDAEGVGAEQGGTGGPPSGAGSTARSGAEPGKVSGSQHRRLSARGPSSALRQIAVIIDRISQPRAVIAVLVTGGSVVLVGFFGQLHWAMRL